jgi:Zn-dependent protease
MNITPDRIRWSLTYVFVLLISVALHEFGHAIMADRLGDDTPRRQGRVTLNPLAHADLVGTLVLPFLMSFAGAGFGWGKPVQWQPHRISRRVSMSTAKVLVAIAGPSMNLLLGTVIIVVHVALVSQHMLDAAPTASKILSFAARANFLLFFFNLLPMPPLDGGHVAQSFMPYRHRDQYEQIARYAPFALLALLLIPALQVVFVWPADFITDHLYLAFAHLFGVA